jgi:vesicle-fusing ATPase
MLTMRTCPGLPNHHGRVQIFEIHTKQMKDNKMMADDISIEELAGTLTGFWLLARHRNTYPFNGSLNFNDTMCNDAMLALTMTHL